MRCAGPGADAGLAAGVGLAAGGGCDGVQLVAHVHHERVEMSDAMTLTIGVDAEVIKLLVAEIRALGDEVRALRADFEGQSADVKKSRDLLERVIESGDAMRTNTAPDGSSQ